MAKGQSGRVVIEMEPEVKRQLHSSLALEGKTLKDWFLERVSNYLMNPPKTTINVQKNGTKRNKENNR